MQETWIDRAALFEALSLGFLITTKELAEVLTSGEYAEALTEIVEANGLGNTSLLKEIEELSTYIGRPADDVFHELRIEYTRLFVGAPKPVVSPFAGTWYAEEIGVVPLMFVNKESMAVERFMHTCGVGQPEGTNEPLDHIGTELEFLQYLCLLSAEAEAPSEDVDIPQDDYEEFYTTHFSSFSKKLADKTIEETRAPFFRVAAKVLLTLPEQPL
jgi:TorA maturation chaperone TorD